MRRAQLDDKYTSRSVRVRVQFTEPLSRCAGSAHFAAPRPCSPRRLLKVSQRGPLDRALAHATTMLRVHHLRTLPARPASAFYTRGPRSHRRISCVAQRSRKGLSRLATTDDELRSRDSTSWVADPSRPALACWLLVTRTLCISSAAQRSAH